LDKEKKTKLERQLNQEVRRAHISGIIAGAFIGGVETEYIANGFEKDTIFRIYSMSKPICAVAIWILIERGCLKLDDPIEQFLPEYQHIKFFHEGLIVSTKRSIRVHHLLNMTAGITYDGEDKPGQLVSKLFDRIHEAMDRGEPFNTREVVKELAKIPLAFEPGTQWRYGLCCDVLGAIIEVVSGKKLGIFYREEIFTPLEMKDTDFFVPKEKQHRFAPLYQSVIEIGTEKSYLKLDEAHHLGLGKFIEPPAFESAGAGLVSTYKDYVRFAQMLANGGILNGRRLLSRETVEGFMKNPLSKEQMETLDFEHMMGYGYGNLMRIRLKDTKARVPGIEKSFGWDGWCGPYVAIDLEQNSFVLFFLQMSAYADWQLNIRILNALLFNDI